MTQSSNYNALIKEPDNRMRKLEPVEELPKTSRACVACGDDGMSVFFRARQAPVFCNVCWPTREEALAAPRGDIELAFCPACGLIHNVAFDPALVRYSGAYENSLSFSPRFGRYAAALARRLVQRHGLHGKSIIEIGCGDGTFLAMLQRIGGNSCIGFDPGLDAGRCVAPGPGLTFRKEPYTQAHARLPADLICCRQVLEHIADPLAFLRQIALTIGRRQASLFCEVPNALYTLRDEGIWDIIYEHCSYFTADALAGLFMRAGFEPSGVTEAYRRQFIVLDAYVAGGSGGRVWCGDNTPRLVREFGHAYEVKLNLWRQRLSRLRKQGARVVSWGAGSKGVTFLNALGISHEQIPYVIDVNPRKHGLYVPVTGQQIVGPEILSQHAPDVVIVMNPIYQREIRAILEAHNSHATVRIA
jgi:hypothetical protein